MIQIEPDEEPRLWAMSDWLWLSLSLAILCGMVVWCLGWCGEKVCQ